MIKQTMIIFFVSLISVSITLFINSSMAPEQPEQLKVTGCRSPVDQGEKLIVTLYEKDGGLHELCSYSPMTTPKGSKDLKDWRRKL